MNLAAAVESHPADRPALLGEGGVTSYGELRDLAAALRGGLRERGVVPGDRIAVVSGNDRDFVAAYLAVLGVGALAVPLNPASPPPELRREIRAVGARLAVAGPAGAEPLAAAAAGGSGPADAGGEGARGEGADGEGAPGEAADGEGTGFDVVAVGDLAGGRTSPLVDRSPADPAVLLFTSGTIGAPRAAILTHGNLAANIGQVRAAAGDALGPTTVALGAIPLFHIFGLNALLGVVLHLGAALVLIERFDPAVAAAAVAEHGATVVSGPPTLWSALAGLPAGESSALAGVQVALSGAAPLDPAVRRLVTERLGLDLREGYGLTEASPVVTSGLGVEAPDGSIGVPLPGVQVRLVDHRGHDVLVGDPGEIWVRGPNVFAGYWNDPEATAAALTDDGWLRTGDVAVVDDDGFLFLVDRAKDLIIVSGFNVYPAEVESVVRLHPAVAEAAVVGVPHERTGETVRAFVVARPGQAVDEHDLVAFCGQHLARYKCPSGISVVPEIPHGVAGKLLRRALR